MGETCCCGCCTVEKGTVIIAVVGMICSLISISKYVVSLHTMVQYPETLPIEIFPGFEDHKALYISMYIGGTIMTIVYGALSWLLFIGARARNYRQCVPWLYWNYICIGCLTPFIIVMCIFIAAAGQVEVGLGTFAFGGAVIILAIYFVCVVRLFVAEIKAEV